MCGRYSITSSAEKLSERFQVDLPEELVQTNTNAAPTQDLPVLLDDGSLHVELLRWGLVPRWAKELKIGNKLFNARGETVEEKPSFRDAFLRRRCLVLADAFYEWQKTASGKQPIRFSLQSQEPFAFAGLWERWKQPDGKEVRSFTIITTSANDLVKPIHDRMPVILTPESEQLWLDQAAGPHIWRDLLQAYPPELMQAEPVAPLTRP